MQGMPEKNKDIPQAGRVGTHAGVAERGRARLYANSPPWGQSFRVPQKASMICRLNFSQMHKEAKSSENRLNNETRGCQARPLGLQSVYERDEKGSLFLDANQGTDLFFKSFHARHVRESVMQRMSKKTVHCVAPWLCLDMPGMEMVCTGIKAWGCLRAANNKERTHFLQERKRANVWRVNRW